MLATDMVLSVILDILIVNCKNNVCDDVIVVHSTGVLDPRFCSSYNYQLVCGFSTEIL